jgi:hypothetical protein
MLQHPPVCRQETPIARIKSSAPTLEHSRSMLLGSIGLIDSSDSVCRISAPGDERQNGRILAIAILPSQPLALVGALSQHLHIGANDIVNPAYFGGAVDFVDVGLFLVKTILQSFYCDIESDLVPELKTVGDGFRG